jgi:hypothetical protein
MENFTQPETKANESLGSGTGNLSSPQPGFPNNHAEIRSSQGFRREMHKAEIPLLMALFYAAFCEM